MHREYYHVYSKLFLVTCMFLVVVEVENALYELLHQHPGVALQQEFHKAIFS